MSFELAARLLARDAATPAAPGQVLAALKRDALKIGQVITEFSPYGAERVAYRIGAALASVGLGSVVIAIRPFHDAAVEDAMFKDLQDRGVEAVRLLSSGSGSRSKVLTAAPRLAAAVKAQGISLLHSHTDIPDFVTAFARFGTPVPVWRTLHNTRIWPGRRMAPAIVERLLRPELEIAVSCDAREAWGPYMRRLGIKRSRPPVVIENTAALEAGDFLPRRKAQAALAMDGSGINFLFLGRLVEQKGFDLLLQAVAREDWPIEATLYVMGDGPLKARLLQMQGPRLHYLGFRADAARHMKAFDALVLPSRFEGSPMVLQEAIAAELPVLASACEGLVGSLGENYPLSIGTLTPSAIVEAVRRVVSGTTPRVAPPIATPEGEMGRRYVELYRRAHG